MKDEYLNQHETFRQAGRKAGKQADRQAGRQGDRQAGGEGREGRLEVEGRHAGRRK
jgi:hypothetical protein